MQIELSPINELYLLEFARFYPGDPNETLLQVFTALRSRFWGVIEMPGDAPDEPI